MDGYKQYIRIDAESRIIDGYSDWQTDKRSPDEILISEDAPRHFQQSWPNLTNERGQYRFKLVNGERVERPQSELDAEWSARPPEPPSDIDRLKSAQADILLALVMNNIM